MSATATIPLAAVGLDRSFEAFGRAVERFAESITSIAPGWFALALLLSLALQVARAHAWSNAIRAAYPGDSFRERHLQGAFLVGVGLNGVLPARGGDAVKIVLAKRSVRDSSYPAIISSFAVLAPFDTAIGLCVLGFAITQGLFPALPELPNLPAFDIAFWAEHPRLLVFVVALLALAVLGTIAFAARHARALWDRLKQGAAIARTPGRYLREVALWQAVGWWARFASFWLFLEAFGIGGSFGNVLLVMAVQSVAGALPFTPGGVGAQQALLVATLQGPTRAAVLAYSVGQQAAVAVWSLLVGAACLVLVFGERDWRRLVREGRRAPTRPARTRA